VYGAVQEAMPDRRRCRCSHRRRPLAVFHQPLAGRPATGSVDGRASVDIHVRDPGRGTVAGIVNRRTGVRLSAPSPKVYGAVQEAMPDRASLQV